MKGKLRHARIPMDRIPGSLVIGVLCVGLCAVVWIWSTLSRGGPRFQQFFTIAVAVGVALAAIFQVREKASKDRLTGRRDGRTMNFNPWHPGLLFVIGITAALLVRVPELWWFFAATIGGGVVIAIVLQRLHGRSGAPPGVT